MHIIATFFTWIWARWTALWWRPRVPVSELPQVRLPSPPPIPASAAAPLREQGAADTTAIRRSGSTPPSLDLNALLDRLARRDDDGGRYYPTAAQQQQAPPVAGPQLVRGRGLLQHGPSPTRAHAGPLYGRFQDLDRTLTLCIQVKFCCACNQLLDASACPWKPAYRRYTYSAGMLL